LRVLKEVPELHMKVDDTVLTYMYHGEGYFDFWVNGYAGNDQIYSPLRCTEATKNEEGDRVALRSGRRRQGVVG
jgi:hypothetical protein